MAAAEAAAASALLVGPSPLEACAGSAKVGGQRPNAPRAKEPQPYPLVRQLAPKGQCGRCLKDQAS